MKRLETDVEVGDFEICKKSDGKRIHLDGGKKLKFGSTTPHSRVLLKKSRDELINNTGENGSNHVSYNFTMCRSNRELKQPDRLCNLSFV